MPQPANALNPPNSGLTGVRAVGYYDDELVRTADGWRIATRRFSMVLLQPDLGVASA